ncbi:MAG: uracil-DNA glycosylase superfamily protein [Anaerolineaceae bacterium]|nr:MAG: uracil-DNA glycosylase superfamily protein [Anaerolineaceae bacterium]
MTLDELNAELLSCRRCPRLVEWREKMAREKRRAYRDEEYWGKPVPGFGDAQARVFVVGLAPGAHGSNRTGRQFTGDASGDFLYPALHRAGFASQPGSASRADGLTLCDLYTAPVCRCAPPDNKPTPEEMRNCQPYLAREIELIQPKVFVALGRIAFDAVLRIFAAKADGSSTVIRPSSAVFAHNAAFRLNTDPLNTEHWLLASYHPSRQNTQTGRLTAEMFDQVWMKARQILDT